MWIAVAAFEGMMLQNFGIAIPSERYVGILLTIAVLAGSVNNPSGINEEKNNERPLGGSFLLYPERDAIK